MLFFTNNLFISFVIIFVSEDIYCSSAYNGRDGTGCDIMKEDLGKNKSRHEGCQRNADANANTTTQHPSNAAQPDADTSASCLLHVTVPSSARAVPDVWKFHQIPEEDDLDKFMKNETGCEYTADRYYHGGRRSVSNSTARGGTWRRRLAVRGDGHASIRVTSDAGYGYDFGIGYNSNTETKVFDYTQDTYVLRRTTPGVMSQERYTQFFYIQLENGVMSFGVLGESTPWLRHDVTVTAGDVIQMEYFTLSPTGVKLLVCA